MMHSNRSHEPSPKRLANGPTLAHAPGKRMVRAYLEGGIGAADRMV